MKKVLLFTILVFIIAHNSFGQNWQCVQSTKNNYFQYPSNFTNEFMLNLVKIDSIKSFVNQDTIFYFPNHLNDFDGGQCLDYIGNWFTGAYLLQTFDGVSVMVTNTNDSCFIHQNAHLQDEWMFCMIDTNYYKAKIVFEGEDNIGGAVDSIKIIKLNSNVTNIWGDFFDTIIISKNHGIIKMAAVKEILALNNNIHGYQIFSPSITDNLLFQEDLDWKYKAGNVWQFVANNGTSFSNSITQDSIIASINYNGGKIIYFQRNGNVPVTNISNNNGGGYGGGISSVSTRFMDTLIVDTVYQMNAFKLGDLKYPNQTELTLLDTFNNGLNFISKYEKSIEMVCDSIHLLKTQLRFKNVRYNSVFGCLSEVVPIKPQPTLGEIDANHFKICQKFGFINNIEGVNSGALEVVYFKINNCEFGTRNDNFATNITSINYVNTLVCYPNPANQFVNFVLPSAYANATIDCINMLGKSFKIKLVNNQLNISSLPDGLYTVQLMIGQKIFHTKLMIHQ